MLHRAVFLVHYLTLMSITSVFAVTTSPTLTRTSHSVVVPFIQRFRGACAFKAQKNNRWPELWEGGRETPIPLIFQCGLMSSECIGASIYGLGARHFLSNFHQAHKLGSCYLSHLPSNTENEHSRVSADRPGGYGMYI